MRRNFVSFRVFDAEGRTSSHDVHEATELLAFFFRKDRSTEMIPLVLRSTYISA
jgi:hypothetical protein